jgi:cyanophycin synthetase
MAHPDNIQLFKDIAKFFDIRLVGIDFLVPDISSSWQNQQCAVLELNSVPCIETHHFPSSGAPQNVANALVDLFFKYYL